MFNCMYCGRQFDDNRAVYVDEDTPLCANCARMVRGGASYGNAPDMNAPSSGRYCERCKCSLDYISDSQVITLKVGSLFKKGGGPLRFKLYECRSCGEYKFFRY